VSKDEIHAFRKKYQGNKEAFQKELKEAYQVTFAEMKAYYEKKEKQGPFHILSAYIAMTAMSELLYGRARRYFDAEIMSFVDRQVRIELFDEATLRAWRKLLAISKRHFGVKQT
jgi:hypothetical protein